MELLITIIIHTFNSTNVETFQKNCNYYYEAEKFLDSKLSSDFDLTNVSKSHKVDNKFYYTIHSNNKDKLATCIIIENII